MWYFCILLCTLLHCVVMCCYVVLLYIILYPNALCCDVLQGGQLVVEHAGRKKSFDFRNCKGYSVCCAAFYAGTGVTLSTYLCTFATCSSCIVRRSCTSGPHITLLSSFMIFALVTAAGLHISNNVSQSPSQGTLIKWLFCIKWCSCHIAS